MAEASIGGATGTEEASEIESTLMVAKWGKANKDLRALLYHTVSIAWGKAIRVDRRQ